jgi:hypothetical protein
METTEKISEKTNLTTLNTSIKSLYPRYTANKVDNVAPAPSINPKTVAKPTNINPILMLMPKPRERNCFIIFPVVSIINDIFFYFCVSRRIGRFIVSRAISV